MDACADDSMLSLDPPQQFSSFVTNVKYAIMLVGSISGGVNNYTKWLQSIECIINRIRIYHCDIKDEGHMLFMLIKLECLIVKMLTVNEKLFSISNHLNFFERDGGACAEPEMVAKIHDAIKDIIYVNETLYDNEYYKPQQLCYSMVAGLNPTLTWISEFIEMHEELGNLSDIIGTDEMEEKTTMIKSAIEQGDIIRNCLNMTKLHIVTRLDFAVSIQKNAMVAYNDAKDCMIFR